MPERETTMMGGPAPFPETSWSLIARCAEDREAGLEQLFRKYWSPVYYFIRRNWGRDAEQAKDLTQSFFLSLCERPFLDSVDAGRGRFRNFVCAALQNFLRNEHRAEHALKRRPPSGAPGSLDQLIEAHVPLPVEIDDPDAQFDHDWKRAVVRAALAALRTEAEARGKRAAAELLELYDMGGERPSYRALAERFEMPVHQVTNWLRWARKTFRECCLAELRDQVASDNDLAAEAAHLFGAELS